MKNTTTVQTKRRNIDIIKTKRENTLSLKKKRKCLKCGQNFSSKGPYNRICEKCSLTNERVSPNTYSMGKNVQSEPNTFDKHSFGFN